ncbi:unnamed protein product [Prorocentrum cordatum]|nr:unnamed protein product [Polarella glacialis]
MARSDSPAIRDALRSNKAGEPNWNYTVFTVVRDPLERMASSLLEAREGSEARLPREQVLQTFDEVTVDLVHRQGGHNHGQRSVPLPAGHPYDLVGTLATLTADWAELGELQKQRFGIAEWPPVPARDRRDSLGPSPGTAMLPVKISQRICNIYRDDYCCFHLPVPRMCRVDCVGGLAVDPMQ